MLKILLIEREKALADRMKTDMQKINASVEIVGNTTSVRESIDWISMHEQPHVIISDTHLEDGLSFDIFSRINIACPLIFFSECDEFADSALRYNSIDFISKPVSREKLERALSKYKTFQDHFAPRQNGIGRKPAQINKIRSRLIARKGREYQAVRTEDVVYLLSEHKLVFAITKDNKKLMVDTPYLNDVFEYLDPAIFFKTGRNFIININFIKRYIVFNRNKLLVEMNDPFSKEIVISQYLKKKFMEWISKA